MDGRNSQQSLIYYMTFQEDERYDRLQSQLSQWLNKVSSQNHFSKLIIYALALPSGWPLLRSPDDPPSSCLIPTWGNVQSQRGNLSLLLLCRKLPYEPLADLSSRHMRQN